MPKDIADKQCISIILGKGGICVAICIVAPQMIDMLIQMVDIDSKFDVSVLWIKSVSGLLEAGDVYSKDIVTSIVVSVVYMVAFYIIGMCINSKKEL